MASNSNSSSTSSTRVDESLMHCWIPTGTAYGVNGVLNAYLKGTTEAKNLLSNECDVILECRVCRNLFRGFPNFISHKRSYCRASAVEVARQQFMMALGEDSSTTDQQNGIVPSDRPERPSSTESCPPGMPMENGGQSTNRNAQNHQKSNAAAARSNGNGGNGVATKNTCNFLKGLAKRIDAAAAAAAKNGSETAELSITTHSLPPVTKLVPFTTFEDGVQVIMNPSMVEKLSAKEGGHGGDGDHQGGDTMTMIVPQDAGSRMHGMSLRTRRQPDASSVVKEIQSGEEELYERLATKYAQGCDLVNLHCLLCKKTFKTLETVAFHFTTCHTDGAGSNDPVCILCGVEFGDSKAHVDEFHREVAAKYDEETNGKKKLPSPNNSNSSPPVLEAHSAAISPTQDTAAIDDDQSAPAVASTLEQEDDEGFVSTVSITATSKQAEEPRRSFIMPRPFVRRIATGTQPKSSPRSSRTSSPKTTPKSKKKRSPTTTTAQLSKKKSSTNQSPKLRGASTVVGSTTKSSPQEIATQSTESEPPVQSSIVVGGGIEPEAPATSKKAASSSADLDDAKRSGRVETVVAEVAMKTLESEPTKSTNQEKDGAKDAAKRSLGVRVPSILGNRRPQNPPIKSTVKTSEKSTAKDNEEKPTAVVDVPSESIVTNGTVAEATSAMESSSASVAVVPEKKRSKVGDGKRDHRKKATTPKSRSDEHEDGSEINATDEWSVPQTVDEEDEQPEESRPPTRMMRNRVWKNPYNSTEYVNSWPSKRAAADTTSKAAAASSSLETPSDPSKMIGDGKRQNVDDSGKRTTRGGQRAEAAAVKDGPTKDVGDKSVVVVKKETLPVRFSKRQVAAFNKLIDRRTQTCLQCNMTFGNKGNCERHVFTHFGFVRFVCAGCNSLASFYPSDLRKHLQHDCHGLKRMKEEGTVEVNDDMDAYILPLNRDSPGTVVVWDKEKRRVKEDQKSTPVVQPSTPSSSTPVPKSIAIPSSDSRKTTKSIAQRLRSPMKRAKRELASSSSIDHEDSDDDGDIGVPPPKKSTTTTTSSGGGAWSFLRRPFPPRKVHDLQSKSAAKSGQASTIKSHGGANRKGASSNSNNNGCQQNDVASSSSKPSSSSSTRSGDGKCDSSMESEIDKKTPIKSPEEINCMIQEMVALSKQRFSGPGGDRSGSPAIGSSSSSSSLSTDEKK